MKPVPRLIAAAPRAEAVVRAEAVDVPVVVDVRAEAVGGTIIRVTRANLGSRAGS
jgi:hypothetical protein